VLRAPAPAWSREETVGVSLFYDGAAPRRQRHGSTHGGPPHGGPPHYTVGGQGDRERPPTWTFTHRSSSLVAMDRVSGVALAGFFQRSRPGTCSKALTSSSWAPPMARRAPVLPTTTVPSAWTAKLWPSSAGNSPTVMTSPVVEADDDLAVQECVPSPEARCQCGDAAPVDKGVPPVQVEKALLHPYEQH